MRNADNHVIERKMLSVQLRHAGSIATDLVVLRTPVAHPCWKHCDKYPKKQGFQQGEGKHRSTSEVKLAQLNWLTCHGRRVCGIGSNQAG